VKKKFTAFLLVCVITLSFAVPAMAAEAVVTPKPINAMMMQEIAPFVDMTPFSEMTQIIWRMYNGELQFRVWGVTSGRWITEWAYVNPPQ